MALSTDPINLKLDADGDIDLSSGDWATNAGVDAVAQAIASALRLFRGEWFLDRRLGMPYLENDYVPAAEALLGQKFRSGYAQDVCSAAIIAIPDVITIVSLSVTFDARTRVMTVDWTVRCTFGDLAGTTEL